MGVFEGIGSLGVMSKKAARLRSYPKACACMSCKILGNILWWGLAEDAWGVPISPLLGTDTST